MKRMTDKDRMVIMRAELALIVEAKDMPKHVASWSYEQLKDILEHVKDTGAIPWHVYADEDLYADHIDKLSRTKLRGSPLA